MIITIRFADQTGIDTCFSSETMSVVPYYTKDCRMTINTNDVKYKNGSQEFDDIYYVEDDFRGYYIKFDPNEISDYVLHSIEGEAKIQINNKLTIQTNYGKSKKYYINGNRLCEDDWLKYIRKEKLNKILKKCI